MSEDIRATLNERGKRYGEFADHAWISQSLKKVMHSCKAWPALTMDKREALDMIQHKIARILNGDPEYDDSWRDIIGYTQLVIDNLIGEVKS